MQEKADTAAGPAPADIVDAVFGISCRCLPVDHAYALSQAIHDALPWFADEPQAGLHLIHGAGSGSGWMRPESPGDLLQLSRRVKLSLRLPRHRVEAAATLLGATLQVAGWPLRIDRLAVKPLSRITTLFSRGVIFGQGGDEAQFMSAAKHQLEALGIRECSRVCGRSTQVTMPGRALLARSLMLAGLTRDESLLLQQQGLGIERKLGFGLFIPHKNVDDLGHGSDSS